MSSSVVSTTRRPWAAAGAQNSVRRAGSPATAWRSAPVRHDAVISAVAQRETVVITFDVAASFVWPKPSISPGVANKRGRGRSPTRQALSQTEPRRTEPLLGATPEAPFRSEAPAFGARPPSGRNRRRGPVLEPYANDRSLRRRLVRYGLPPALGVLCLAYGFFFAVTAPYLILPFAIPVVLVAGLAIWALPESATAPTRTMELFFAGLFIGLILWPNYLALALPGLPWITMIRITGFPMVFLFLVSLSMSARLRDDLAQAFADTPLVWRIFAVFVVLQFASIPFAASHFAGALQRVVINQVNWTFVFLIAAYVCRTPGRAQSYIGLVVALAVPILAISLLEASHQSVLWRNHVPTFLKVPDEVAQLYLAGSMRSGLGIYRTKATFSTALGLSEYLALITPFVIHYGVGRYPVALRLFSVAMLPVIFLVVRQTDSRLGVVGFFISFLLYFLVWSVRRFRHAPRDLLATAIVYAAPVVFAVAAGSVLIFHRVNVLVLGGGAQAGSDAARQAQLAMGIPKILSHPFGHGAGMSGLAMGYAPGEFITVDNYYLSIGLEYGVVGLACFFLLFLIPMIMAAKYAIQTPPQRSSDLELLMPLSVALVVFLVIKSVFSQPDNHPIAFLYLGMTLALAARARQAATDADAQLPQDAAATKATAAAARWIRSF